MPKKARINKRHFYALSDFLISFGMILLSFFAYFGVDTFVEQITVALSWSAGVSLATVIIFFLAGVYKIIIKDIGIREVVKISFITFAIRLIDLVILFIYFRNIDLFNVFFSWFATSFFLLYLIPGSRVAVRVYQLVVVRFTKAKKIATIVVGAGSTGKVVIDETRKNSKNNNAIVAFVDDDPNKIGGYFQNIVVKGPISDIKKIVEYTNAKEVIIAISNISEDRLQEILVLLRDLPVRVKRMPLLSEMEGPNDKRIIDVDLNDLLRRNVVGLDNSSISSMIEGNTILVTGAGGSIGSELVRQIYSNKPKTLILFDIYENSTYDIQMELKRKQLKNKSNTKVITLIGSTYDEYRIESVIKKYKPDYIYHAAAYKHVPLMEDSPMEAIRTNVIGTYNVARFADKYGVKKMILVSTDKAVRPTNVMGATKRFAETIIQYFDSKSSNTNYAAVRFGNVLGSNGSVVPLFKKQIEDGGPITLTDKNIIRYFMTIPEAVSLILQCGLFASDGEIFILDMGEPVKIIDLAERMIRQAGYLPYIDIDIIEIGLRPGEKLYEELLLDKEHQKKTDNERIYIEEKEYINDNLENDVKEASKAFNMPETSDVKELLASLINTYQIDKSHN